MSNDHLVGAEISCVAQYNYSQHGQVQQDSRDEVTIPRIRPVPRLKYRFTWFKKAGAMITLYWSFVVFVALHHALNIIGHTHGHAKLRQSAFIGSLVFPILGMLTDAYVSRYKFIRVSILVMWMGSLSLPVAYLPSIIDTKYGVYLRIVGYSLLSIGTLCCQMNMVQFGTNQLKDSSSTEITSYLKWYAWTYFASMVMVDCIQVCLVYTHNWISYFYLPTLISVALCVDFLFGYCLVVDQMTQNSWALIFGILKYAMKNRYPKLRTSFVYWDNKCCSRIELAKTTFGGPFSVKQVEEVKSFFQVSVLMFLAGVFLCVVSINDWLIIQPYEVPEEDILCLAKLGTLKGGYMFIAVCFPFYEWILLPFTQIFLPHCKIFLRMAVGGFFSILYLTLNLIFIAIKKWNVHSHMHRELDLPHWFVSLSVLNCIGLYMMIVAGAEFLCAQCPQCMRGFVCGLFYFIYCASYGIIFNLESKYREHYIVYLCNVILVIVLATFYLILSFFYKMRQHYQNSQEHY